MIFLQDMFVLASFFVPFWANKTRQDRAGGSWFADSVISIVFTSTEGRAPRLPLLLPAQF